MLGHDPGPALFAVDGLPQGVKESAFGGFDAAAVQLHDRCAGVSGPGAERGEQGRLAASADPMDLDDGRAVIVETAKEPSELFFPSDQPPGRALGQQVSDSSSHDLPALGRAATRDSADIMESSLGPAPGST
jgi:hypothetical protein